MRFIATIERWNEVFCLLLWQTGHAEYRK